MNIINVGYHSTNYYALELIEGKLLVDCGWPNTFPHFSSELKRKGIEPLEIKYILATHFHPDHAGLVEEFKQIGAKLLLMESQVDAIDPAGRQAAAKFPSKIYVTPTDNILLSFSESRHFLASLGLAGEIISTPGHSHDSVTLILDNGFAFTGDLPPRFIVPEEDNLTRGSWDRIYSHNVTRVFPAHGS